MMTNEDMIELPSKLTYSIRAEIKSAGGKWNGSEWHVTAEQLATLRDEAVTSYRRSNKRDRAFGVAWALVEEELGGTEWADALAKAEAEAEAYRLAHQ